MSIRILIVLFLFCQSSFIAFSQGLQVEIPNQDPGQWLAQELQGDNIEILSVSYRGDERSLGTFGDGTLLGLEEGVILSTGRALDANLSNDDIFQVGGDMNSGHTTSPLDGITHLPIKDENSIQITFIPTRNKISFEFAYATEEWPFKLCVDRADVFGVFLVGEGAYGPYQDQAENLAHVPGTMLPINLENVRGAHPNADTCPPLNEEYWIENPLGAPFPFNSYTTVFTGEAAVIPNTVYRLEIIIGDVSEDMWDSAIFFSNDGLNATNGPILPFDLPNDVFVESDDCEEINLCLPILEQQLNSLYELEIDGIPYTGTTTPCTYTKRVYDLFTLVDQAGPLMMNWDIDGNAYSAHFNTLMELRDSMNFHDPEGYWYFDGTSFGTAIAGGYANKTYSEINVTQLLTGAQFILGLNEVAFSGTQISLNQDDIELSITDTDSGNLDVMNLDINCSIPVNHTTESIFVTIPVEKQDFIFCTESNLGFVPVLGTQNICPDEETNAASFTLSGNGEQITMIANELGISKACYRYCDDGEINCHTKEITVEVINNDEIITWNYVPEDQTAVCGQIPPAPTDVMAFSTCPSGIEVEFFESVGTCFNDQIIIRREFRASHACGFGDTIAYRIIARDNRDPIFTVPFEDLTLPCNDPDFETKVEQWLTDASVAEDDCMAEVAIDYGTYGHDYVIYNCTEPLKHEIFMIAWDECGNFTSRSAFLRTTPIASDFYRDTLYYDLQVGVPQTIDLADELFFIPTNLTGQCRSFLEMEVIEEPSISVVLTALDAEERSTCISVCSEDFDECVEIVFVVNAIDGVEFTTELSDLVVSCDDIPSVDFVEAESACPTGQVSIIFEELVSSAQCDGTFEITRNWTANDACGNEESLTQIIQVFDDQSPTFTNVPMDITFDCNDPNLQGKIDSWLSEISAADNCSLVELSNDHEFNTNPCAAPSSTTITFTANDDCGNMAFASAVLNIIPPADEDFVFTFVPADLTISCEDFDPVPSEFPEAVSPNCPGPITYSFVDVEQSLGCEQSFILERTWTAIDPCGNGVSVTTIIGVEDLLGPVAEALPLDVTFSCDDSNLEGEVEDWAYSLGYGQYKDNCSGYEILNEFNFIPIPDCNSLDTIWTQEYQFFPTDLCGNWTEFSATLTILPLNAGNIIVNADLTVLFLDCDVAVPDPQQVTAFTNCEINDEVEISFAESRVDECVGAFTLLRVWDFTDECGNVTQVSRQLIFRDNEAPEFLIIPDDITLTLTAGEVVPETDLLGIVVTDNCSTYDDPMYEDSIRLTSLGFIVDRMFFTTDDCGNFGFAIQEIEVVLADVWPGDTDSTKVVDQFDLFNIGFAHGTTGPERNDPSTDWVGQVCPYWNQNAPDGTNYKHIDTDGNGVIDDADTLAVSLNWGFEHDFRPEDESRSVSPLNLELISVNGETGWIRMGIMLGNSAENIQDFYGFGYAIDYDQTRIDASSMQVAYEQSWVGTHLQDYLSISKNTDGVLHSAIVKKDQEGSSGFGKVGEIVCRVKDEFIDEVQSLTFEIDLAQGVFLNGETFTTNHTETIIEFEPVGVSYLDASEIRVFPNPASDRIFYSLRNDMEVEELVLINAAGLEVAMQVRSDQYVDLNGFAQGLYYLKFYTEGGVIVKKFVLNE